MSMIMNQNRKKKNLGLSLIELMISMVLGLLLMAAVLAVYLKTLENNAVSLNSTRLNQESATLLNVMIREIRRAGFDGDFDLDNPFSNDFNALASGTAISVHDYSATTGTSSTINCSDVTDLTTSDPSTLCVPASCILFSYDRDRDGAVDAIERRGFRLDDVNKTIEMRVSASSADANNCANGTWQSISDANVISIEALTFSMVDSRCLNFSTLPEDFDADSDGDISGSEITSYLASANCLGTQALSGDDIMMRRVVEVGFGAQLISDALVSFSRTLNVEIRNDLFYEIP